MKIADSLIALFAAAVGALAALAPAHAAETPVQARGRYLAENVALCVDCHSGRDFSKYSGPAVPGTEGRGGAPFGADLGLPGTFHAKNITPAKLGAWSDDEIRRAVTAGVSKDGTPLFPIMPFPAFARLCEPDMQAILTYVRSLKPIEGDVPPADWKIPKPATAGVQAPKLAATCPDPNDTVAQGRYLVTIASCGDCHTPKDERGQPLPGRLLSGGVPLPVPSGGVSRSANLTPDASGLGPMSREAFVSRFRAHRGRPTPVAPGQPNTLMPWTMYAGMTDADLGAIYDYLRTIPPVKNEVVRFTAAR